MLDGISAVCQRRLGLTDPLCLGALLKEASVAATAVRSAWSLYADRIYLIKYSLLQSYLPIDM